MFNRLDSLLSGSKPREVIEVHEREAPTELVAAKDVTRRDALGRTVVVVPGRDAAGALGKAHPGGARGAGPTGAAPADRLPASRGWRFHTRGRPRRLHDQTERDVVMAARQSQHPGVRGFLYGKPRQNPDDPPAIPPNPPTARGERGRVTRPERDDFRHPQRLRAEQPSATEWTPLST